MSTDVDTRATSTSADRGIVVDALSHGYGETPVLDTIALDLASGELLTIIGPSGTGKTTLLQLLAMFEPPDGGTITIDGEAVWSVSPSDRRAIRRRTGMVFQEAALFDASVANNVAYGLHVRKPWVERLRTWWRRLGEDTPNGRITQALAAVGMADQLHRHAGDLSGGEAQRVAFARALAYRPRYLFLDEPTSDLDPRNTAVIEDAVTAATDAGTGVVLATHDMHQARRIADRVAVMIDGSIIEMGPTDRVFDDPNDPRARQFIDGELVY